MRKVLTLLISIIWVALSYAQNKPSKIPSQLLVFSKTQKNCFVNPTTGDSICFWLDTLGNVTFDITHAGRSIIFNDTVALNTIAANKFLKLDANNKIIGVSIVPADTTILSTHYWTDNLFMRFSDSTDHFITPHDTIGMHGGGTITDTTKLFNNGDTSYSGTYVFHGYMKGLGGFVFQNTASKVVGDNISYNSKSYFGLVKRLLQKISFLFFNADGVDMSVKDTVSGQYSSIEIREPQINNYVRGRAENYTNVVQDSSFVALNNINTSSADTKFNLFNNVVLTTQNNGFGLKMSRANEGSLWNYENAPIYFGTNNLQRMTIAANGNIGIGGALLPLHFLSVVGSSTTNRYLYNYTNGTFNKLRTTIAQATDTCSHYFYYTVLGKPVWGIRNQLGAVSMGLDSLGLLTLGGGLTLIGAQTIKTSSGNLTLSGGTLNDDIIVTMPYNGTAKFKAFGGGVHEITRSFNVPNGYAGANGVINIYVHSPNSVGSGFGSILNLGIGTGANYYQLIGLAGLRNGADNTGLIAFNVATTGTFASKAYINNTGRFGIGFNNPISTIPTLSYTISLDGTAARTMGGERNTVANQPGYNFTMYWGSGATSGSTDKNAGSAIFATGEKATGNGGSDMYFQTITKNQGAGTTDRIPSTKMTLLDNGYLGIGTTSPTSPLQVIGLPIYANNAAAVAGGLTTGALYRTNADPDPVCVVH